MPLDGPDQADFRTRPVPTSRVLRLLYPDLDVAILDVVRQSVFATVKSTSTPMSPAKIGRRV